MKLAEMLALAWVFILLAFYSLIKAGSKRVPAVDIRADYFRRSVAVAGGEYVGIQECDVDHSLDCVLFNSPLTGSTLAVKVGNFTAVAVENRLAAHHHDWEVSQENARLII
jgi:hypothetical protein